MLRFKVTYSQTETRVCWLEAENADKARQTARALAGVDALPAGNFECADSQEVALIETADDDSADGIGRDVTTVGE